MREVLPEAPRGFALGHRFLETAERAAGGLAGWELLGPAHGKALIYEKGTLDASVDDELVLLINGQSVIDFQGHRAGQPVRVNVMLPPGPSELEGYYANVAGIGALHLDARLEDGRRLSWSCARPAPPSSDRRGSYASAGITCSPRSSIERSTFACGIR